MGKRQHTEKADVLQGTLILLVLRTLDALGPLHLEAGDVDPGEPPHIHPVGRQAPQQTFRSVMAVP
jgi:hypothetical protein